MKSFANCVTLLSLLQSTYTQHKDCGSKQDGSPICSKLVISCTIWVFSKQKNLSCNIHYLGKMFDIVTSLTEGSLDPFDVDSSSLVFLPTENAGWLGLGRATVSLANMTTTVDMVGLSAASSWTHNKPMCMHFITSLALYVFSSTGSNISKLFPSHQSLQLCMQKRKNVICFWERNLGCHQKMMLCKLLYLYHTSWKCLQIH